MKEFFSYFFGQGTEPEFALLSFAHLAPILLMLGVIALIYRFREGIRKSRWEEKLRWGIAFALVICDILAAENTQSGICRLSPSV